MSQGNHPLKKATKTVRLQKVIASSGTWSRRKAEELIAAGRVSVNGQLVTEMGTQIIPTTDKVQIDGESLQPRDSQTVILLNKPMRTVTTRFDPEGRRTVMDLLPPEFQFVKPVGRLDYDTEGLLLLTSDGTLANRLAHPRYGVLKTYEAWVFGIPRPETLSTLTRRVELSDGPGRFESIQFILQKGENTLLEIKVSEGRNRFVRRMLEAVSHPVRRLRRIRIGSLGLDSLKPGQFRTLTDKEVALAQDPGTQGPIVRRPPGKRPLSLRLSPENQ